MNADLIALALRIMAVGPRATVELPADAAIVDVSGRSVLPGLWDMRAHLAGITDFGPIYLAAGVATVRDLGERERGLHGCGASHEQRA